MDSKTMIPNRKKILIVAGLTILAIAILFGALALFRTDPTPPQIRAGWYLPDQDIVWTKTGSGTYPSLEEHLVLSGKFNGPASRFPGLSPYCRYVNYTHEITGHKYMIAVWYFNDDQRFLESQKKLEDFLKDTGKITTVELNFTDSTRAENRSGNNPNSPYRNLLPSYLTTSGYESTNTTGLFFVVKIPGPGIQYGDRNYAVNYEYYIVYYGTTDPATLVSRTQLLKEMIGETYAYDRVVYAGPLFS